LISSHKTNQTAKSVSGHSYQVLKEQLHRRLVASLDLAAVEDMENPAVAAEVERLTWDFIDQEVATRSTPISTETRQQLYEDLQDELFRFGPLEPLLQDSTVSDILVNDPNEIYVERFGQLEKIDARFADNDHLLRIIQRIVGLVGRRIDRADPLVDARLPDGSRVNAVIPPLSIGSPKLSIRRFVQNKFDLDVLKQGGTLTSEMAEFLEAIVTARVSVLFSGGTGAGKTTLLSATSRAIPDDERIVTIEDSAELVLQHPHVVSLETRPANQEGCGEYSVRDLVRNSLRMRPDRIIIGEVRGSETIDMIQAMNTGHEGSMTTVHSNGTRDALARLELMIAMARIDLPVETIRELIAMAIPVVVHLERLRGGERKVMRISEYISDGHGSIEVADIFRFVIEGVRDGKAIGHFEATGHQPTFSARLEQRGIRLDPSIFAN